MHSNLVAAKFHSMMSWIHSRWLLVAFPVILASMLVMPTVWRVNPSYQSHHFHSNHFENDFQLTSNQCHWPLDLSNQNIDGINNKSKNFETNQFIPSTWAYEVAASLFGSLADEDTVIVIDPIDSFGASANEKKSWKFQQHFSSKD